VDVDQFLGDDFEAELLAQHPYESETRVGDRVVVVEHHRQARRTARGWHRKDAFLIEELGGVEAPIFPD
jgi:hypothetical protein